MQQILSVIQFVFKSLVGISATVYNNVLVGHLGSRDKLEETDVKKVLKNGLRFKDDVQV